MASNAIIEEPDEMTDALQFWLFPHDTNGKLIINEEALESLVSDYLAHLSSYIHPYLWNCEPFSLTISSSSPDNAANGNNISLIQGKLIVGDYIEDEWFCIFLLLKLTSAYPGLICRVVDNDGEFLLIEAADHLPKWANPESAERRVYLKEGKVHLIPPWVTSRSSSKSSYSTETPEVMDAVATVNAKPSETLANPAIQRAIQFRIEQYPEKVSKDQHIAHAYVPVGVAALLREYPTLIGPSVKAFCRRSDKDAKILRVMRHFPPEQRVLTAVRFSKALFAQLAAHSYSPDELTGWRLPSPTHSSHKAFSLGMKLACGFEILVCQAGGVTPLTPSTDNNPIDEFDKDNPKWLQYKQSLSGKGYFRGEPEGSKFYCELEENAHRFFTSNVLLGGRSDKNTDYDPLSTGAAIIKLLSKVNADYDFFKERQSRITPADDEKWLEITTEHLDQLLKSNYGKDGAGSKGDLLNQNPDDPEIPPELRHLSARKLSQPAPKKHSHSRKPSMGRKMSGMTSHPQHRKISTQSNASDYSNASEMSSFSNKIDFNAESFTEALHNILELGVPDDEYWNHSDEDGSSGMSSYEDENEGDLSLSRKTSDGSQSSKASSGVDPDFEKYFKSLEKDAVEEKDKNVNKPKPKKRGQRIPLADLEGEFDDIDEFKPVEIDIDKVKEMLQGLDCDKGSGKSSQMKGSFGEKYVKFAPSIQKK